MQIYEYIFPVFFVFSKIIRIFAASLVSETGAAGGESILMKLL